MKKIPTLFKRDPDNRSRVLPELAVDLPDGAVATVKYDGSCIMFDGSDWWKRREVRPGKPIPEQFDEVDHDPVTGKRQGWVPIGDGPEDKWFREVTDGLTELEPATFEAVGPHFQGNPHGYTHDVPMQHGLIGMPDAPTDYDGLRIYLGDLNGEGIVWWANEEPVAKIKRRDFGYPWPIPTEATS